MSEPTVAIPRRVYEGTVTKIAELQVRVKELKEALELAMEWLDCSVDDNMVDEDGTTIRESLERALRGEEKVDPLVAERERLARERGEEER